MRNMILILISVLSLILAGCSTAPARQDAPIAKKIEASYFDKVEGVPLSEARGECPKSEAPLAEVSWEKMMPMAAACVKAQDWFRLEQVGNALATRGHRTPWGPYYLSLSAESRKDYPRAIWMLELAIKKAPKEGILHYQLGRIHWLQGNDIVALKNLKQASELNPSLTDAHFISGVVALNSDKLGEAESALKLALRNDSRHFPATMAMADLKMKAKDWEGAVSFLERAISLNSRSQKARVALATVQETQLKRLDAALSTYRDLKRLNASNKLDAPLGFSVEDKIKSLEGMMVQAVKQKQVSSRKPSTAEGVAK